MKAIGKPSTARDEHKPINVLQIGNSPAREFALKKPARNIVCS